MAHRKRVSVDRKDADLFNKITCAIGTMSANDAIPALTMHAAGAAVAFGMSRDQYLETSGLAWDALMEQEAAK